MHDAPPRSYRPLLRQRGRGRVDARQEEHQDRSSAATNSTTTSATRSRQKNRMGAELRPLDPPAQGCGRGVAATLGGRIGNTTCGCFPVSERRKAVTSSISASESSLPSCATL